MDIYFSTAGDLVALLLIIATFFYLISSIQSVFIKDTAQLLHSKNTILFYSLFIVLLHYLMAVNSLFIQDQTLNDSDTFLWWANQYANVHHGRGYSIIDSESQFYLTIGAQFYKQYLALFSIILGTSSLFFSCLTIFLFTISLVYFIKICTLLNIRNLSGWTIILFGGIPGFLLITIEPYREIYMILFLMMSIYYGFRFALEGKFLYLPLTIILLILFGMFHFAAMAMTPFLFLLIILFPASIQFSLKQKIKIIVFFSIFIVGIVFSGLYDNIASNREFGHVFDLFRSNTVQRGNQIFGFIDKINSNAYYLRLSPGNSTYYWNLNDTSFLLLVKSFLQCIIYYMFKPFVWEVSSISSLVLFLEGMLRFLLIVFSITFIFKADNNRFRALYILMLTIYFFIEIVWALGTSNSGTASRHHLVSQWILIMLGGAGLIEFIKYIISVSFNFLNRILHQLVIPKKLTLGK